MRLISSALVAVALLLSSPVFAQPAATATPGADTPTSVQVQVAPTPSSPSQVTVSQGAGDSKIVSVSGGSLIGEVIMWVALVLGVPVAGFIVRWIQVAAKKMGIDVSDAARARLQEMVENGIALGAQRAQADLKDKLPIEVKGQVAQSALQYVKDHGADTLKGLGFDPSDPKTTEALQARVAKALNDIAPPPAPAPPAPV